jgi:N-acyl-D-aspartate/D-glutamate deacylase
MFDCLIRSGLVVDGTGQPARRADIAIRDGRIVEIGLFPDARAEVEIDAAGRVVMPGIIDHHTHYDPQLDFDPYATPSCLHGVTTVVSGHCGFSIAPCAPGDRDFLTKFFAAVEGMSPSVLEHGLGWTWQSFPQYLDQLEGRLGVNAAVYVGHSSVRRHAMGEAASERKSDASELDAMKRIVKEAVEAGAIGLSSASCLVDRDQLGRPVPSCFGDFDEIEALAEVAGAAGGGSIAFLPDSAILGIDPPDTERLIQIAQRAELPVIIQGMGHRLGQPELWERDQRTFDAMQDSGARIYSSYRTQPYRRPFTWSRGTSLFDGVFEWRELSGLPPDERLARLADPTRRSALREGLDRPNTDGRLGATLPPPPLDCLFVQHSQSRPEIDGRSIADLCQETGDHPADSLAELIVADALATEFVYSNESDEWIAITGDSAKHPNLLVGVGDCGAHVDRDDGAEWSTYFMSRWVRDRGLYSLEEGVQRITDEPARLLGLRDRGRLEVGCWADAVILDLDRLELGHKRLVQDLPGGGERWQVEVEGIERVLVNGETIVERGRIFETKPGHVIRGRA